MSKFEKLIDKVVDKLHMPIEEAYKMASEFGGRYNKPKGWKADWKKFDKKAMRRIKLFNLNNWLHWWRWKSFFKISWINFEMWQLNHYFRCTCVDYHRETGKHRDNCPKSRYKWWQLKRRGCNE